MKRIRIVMADMDTYHIAFGNGRGHHILLSNCHRFPDWIETGVCCAMRDGSDYLMIGVDV